MKIVTAYQGDRLVGVFPLCIRRGVAKEGKARVLEFSGGSQSDLHDIIVDPQTAGEVVQQFETQIDVLRSSVDVVRLQNMPADSLSVGQLCRRYQPYISMIRHPFLDLTGDYPLLEKKWRASHRGDVRRQRRRLEQQGALALEVIGDIGTALKKLDEFFAVYRTKWRSDRNPRVLKDPLWQGPLQQFYIRLCTALGLKCGVHFSVLTLAGRPISFHFGFLYRGRLYYYRPTYDRSYQNFSPGKVHIAMLLELGCEEGWREFDFLLGDEDYKYAWTNQERYAKTLTFRGKRAVLGCMAAWWLGRGQSLARRYIVSAFHRGAALGGTNARVRP
jgi:CelD/BcsL family acetyltransferase involved in cellulose biosynthesis